MSKKKDSLGLGIYRDTVENARLPIMFADQAMVIVLCNQAFASLVGYSREEIQGRMAWTEFIRNSADLERMKEYHCLRRQNPTLAPASYECHLLNRSGQCRDISLSVTMLPGTGLSVAMLQDITDKKQSETWYRAIFENTGLPSIIIDPDTTIIKANTEWALLAGYAIEEIENRMSWTAFIHPDDVQRMIGYHETRREDAGNAPRKYEFRFVRRNGEVRHMINSVTMIPGSKFSIASLMDITELRHADEKRKKLEDQLQQVRKLESIGHLAGGVAHDFNNMLAAILGYSQLIQMKLKMMRTVITNKTVDLEVKKSTMPESARSTVGDLTAWLKEQLTHSSKVDDMVEDVIKASLRAKDITNQLLAFARKQTLEVKVLYLNHIIEEFVKILRRTIRENIAIELHLNPENNPIEADAGQLQQIILNLVINAQDAMPNGGKILISTENRLIDSEFVARHQGIVPGPFLQLSISDTGIGMSEEVKSKIFEPFFTTKDVGKGTGLGLATVYGIVKQHNGSIWFYSEAGLGTTFHIYFPQVNKQPASAAAAGEHKPVSTPSETVLVVEDQDEVRRMTCGMLTQLGYRVLEAENARQALRVSGEYRASIELLVSDVVMPGMNGRELYRELLKTRPELKALFVSGYPREIVTSQGILENGLHFMAKPLLIDELGRKLLDVLSGQPG